MDRNDVTIPEAVVQRVIERRVGFAVVPAASDIVPAVNRLAAAVRETGGGVFWIKMTHDERCFSEWSVAYELPTP